MWKNIVLIMPLVFFGNQLTAQVVAVNGIVRDADTERPLAGANVLVSSSGKGSVTDVSGKFQIEVTAGDYLIVSFIGFLTDTMKMSGGNREVEIFLKPTEEVLQEVVVSAVSRASLIKENPIAVSTVSARMIERSGENNLMDALSKNTPGLSTLKTGPNISKPFIRGMGFNRVLTLYDGVRQEGQQYGGEHGLEVDNYNIERAEVIKGPASLVYGSDALAGVVSLMPFISKEDDKKIRGRIISEYQSNNGLIGNGFRLSQGSKQWLWMIRGSYRLARNYTNSVDGRVYNTGFDEKNLSALFGLKGEHGHTNFNLTLYDNLQGIPDGSRDSLTRQFTKQIYEGDLDVIKNRPIVSSADLNSYSLSPLHQRIQHYRAYVNSHYHAGKGDINATLAFSQNIRREFSHPAFPDLAGTYLQLNTLNYNVRYNAPEFSGVEASIGVNGMFQTNKIKEATSFPIPNYDLTDFGIFAVMKWKKENWTVVGGARLDTRSVRTSDFYLRTDANGFEREAVPPDTVGATRQFSAATQFFSGASISAGFTYQLSSSWSLKFNFSRGYRAPSISEIAANGLDAGAHIIYIGNKNFESEFSWQEDLGLFASSDSYSASLSLFNKNIQNYIYLNQLTNSSGQPIEDAQGNRTFQYQQSSAQLYGLEATFDLHPASMKGFSWNNQFALTYGINGKKDFENTGVMGEYLPFIPPPHLLSALNYERPMQFVGFSSIHSALELEYTATQNRYLSLFDTETRTPGYSLVNASLGLDTPSGKRTSWQLQFQVNNLFDIAYQSNLSRLKYFEYYTASPNGRYGIYGMGRNLVIKMIFTF